jgi:hypothetical protein
MLEMNENGSRAVEDQLLSTTAWFNNSGVQQPFDASCYGMDHPDSYVMTSHGVYLFMSLAFVAVGLVSNALSVAVFTSREMRAVSSNVYLLVLAVSDSLYLLSVFLTRLLPMARCWYFPEALVDIGNRSHIMCVTLQYLSDLFSDYSTCLILAFTVERSLAVFCPIAFKERCTVIRARLVCVIMFAVIAVTIFPYHVIMIQLYVDFSVCVIDKNYEEEFAALYVVEMVTFRVVPVATIAVLNAFIIVRVTRLTRDKNRRRRQAALKTAKANGGVENGSVAAGGGGADGADRLRLMVADDVGPSNSHVTQHHQHNCENDKHHHMMFKRRHSRRASIDDRNRQLTIILILVSSSYILAYIPVLLHFVMVKMKMNHWIDTSEEMLTIFGNYGKTLYIGGFAINFFLYTMSGRVFRDQLSAMLCAWVRGQRFGHGKKRPTSDYVPACAGGGPCGGTLETEINGVAEATSVV